MTPEKEEKLKKFWANIKDSDILSGAVVNLSYDDLWNDPGNSVKKMVEQLYDAAAGHVKYKKQIIVCETGQVIATIWAEHQRKVGGKIWKPIFCSKAAIKKTCKKAHRWADEMILICLEQEHNVHDQAI